VELVIVISGLAKGNGKTPFSLRAMRRQFIIHAEKLPLPPGGRP
jgi:hypothetical protein